MINQYDDVLSTEDVQEILHIGIQKTLFMNLLKMNEAKEHVLCKSK